jgi:hypothetical protein
MIQKVNRYAKYIPAWRQDVVFRLWSPHTILIINRPQDNKYIFIFEKICQVKQSQTCFLYLG